MKKNNLRMGWILFLFLFSLPVIISYGIYYTEKDDIEIKSKGGRPAVTLEAVDENQKLFFTPGTIGTYTFRIKNSDQIGQSEIKLKYRITFETDTEHVVYSLKKNGSTIPFTKVNDKYQSDVQFLACDKEQIDTYILEADCSDLYREAYLFSTAKLYLDSEQAVD